MTTPSARKSAVVAVKKQIATTVVAALDQAAGLGLATLSFPIISSSSSSSGSSGNSGSGTSQFQAVEEQAAREAVVGAIAVWLRTNATIRRIDLLAQPGRDSATHLKQTFQKIRADAKENFLLTSASSLLRASDA